MDTNPHIIYNGMRQQLQVWRNTVSDRGLRLGWKTGFSLPADQQRLQLPGAMVGFLSEQHRCRSGGHYHAADDAVLLVEPEVAIQMGANVPAAASAEQALNAIAGYTAALELVDTTRSVDDDLAAMLAGNLFHAGVVFADTVLPACDYRREQLSLSLCINGEEVRTLAAERLPEDFSAIILAVANTLAAHGEQLQKGDWIITGAATQPVAVADGDAIELEMGMLGNVTLQID